MCSMISDQIINCPKCKALYCRDCVLWNKNEKLASISNNKLACIECLNDLSTYKFHPTCYDNFKVKDSAEPIGNKRF